MPGRKSRWQARVSKSESAPEHVFAVRAIQGHTVSISDDRDSPGWKRLPEEAAEDMALYHGTCHEHIERIVVAGLTTGGIGGGRKRRDIDFTMEDAWGSRNPISGIRGEVEFVMVVDAGKGIKDCMQFWANPSGAIFSNIMPKHMLSIMLVESSQLWTNISDHVCLERSKVPQTPKDNVEQTAESRPETPPESQLRLIGVAKTVKLP